MTAHARPIRRILLMGGEHFHRSIGDVAMLQVTIGQIRRLFPDAAISVISASPFRLGQYASGVTPAMITPGWRRAVASAEYTTGRLAPDPIARVALASPRAVRDLGRSLLRRRGRPAPVLGSEHEGDGAPAIPIDEEPTIPDDEPLIADEVNLILRRHVDLADLLVVYGGGFIADADRHKAALAFRAMRFALDAGTPYALTGQGIGPLTEPGLVAAAKEVLPGALAVGTREDPLSRATLAGCDVAAERIHFTGDDALLMVHQAGQPTPGEPLVGLSYRQAHYLGLADDDFREVHEGLRSWLHPRIARWLPLVTSTYGNEDLLGVREVLGEDARNLCDPPPARPEDLIRGIGSCSMVLSTTYHAALFAASSGVPTLAFGGSDYGLAKLAGIRACFGEICSVVDVRDGIDGGTLSDVFDRITEPANRARALDAVVAFQEAIRCFYRQIPDLLDPARA